MGLQTTTYLVKGSQAPANYTHDGRSGPFANLLRSYKVPVVIQPAFTVYFERSKGHTFGHCDIHVTWTAQVKRDLAVAFKALCVLHSEKIYAQHSPGDAKHEKFLKMFGFKFVEEFADTSSGETRHLYSLN